MYPTEPTTVTPVTSSSTRESFARRHCPANTLADDAEVISGACHAMARRFHHGGRLVVFGTGASVGDAAHVVVEFLHPVIVGKRALPAFALTPPELRAQLELLATPADIALGLAAGPPDDEVADALASATSAGLLTVALLGGDGGRVASEGSAEHQVLVRADDPPVVKEVQVTAYHVLWELVHVFLERPGVLS